MSTKSLSIKYRPIRIGLLVRQDSVEDLVTAAGMNTLLLGGIFNPIIPVPANNHSAETLMTLFNVDILHSVFNDQAIDDFLAKYPRLHNPFFVSTNFFYEDWEKKRNSIMYLDSLNIIDYYWEREFKDKPHLKGFDPRFTLIKWLESDPLRNLFSICFGYYPDCYNLRDDFEYRYLNHLQATLLRLAPGEVVRSWVGTLTTPIGLTGLELKGHDERKHQHGIYVGDENEFDDLIHFWNLRATGLSLQFVPKNHIERVAGVIKAHLLRLDDSPNLATADVDVLSAHCLAKNIGEVKEIVQRFPCKKRLAPYPCDIPVLWNEGNIRVSNVFINEDHSLANISKTNNRYTVSLSLPQIPIINKAYRNVERQSLIASVNPEREDNDYPLHTLRPPLIRELNGFYGWQILANAMRVRAEEHGVRILIDPRSHSLSLAPIPFDPLVKEVFDYAGIQTEVSRPGIILRQILQKLGGLEGGRIFKVTGVRRLLNSLLKDASITIGQAKQIMRRRMFFTENELRDLFGSDFDQVTSEYFHYRRDEQEYVLKNLRKGANINDERVSALYDGDFKRFEKLYIERREEPRLSADRVWEFLLRKEFFRAGLDLECGYCKLSNWLPLREVDDWWTCIYCGGKNQTSPFLRSGNDWRFRKSGLFARDNNQEGAVPVILTLLQFHRRLNYFGYVYSPSLNLKLDSRKCEIDFCVLQYHHGHPIELGIAECKSTGGKITHQDVDNLKSVGHRLQAVAIKPVLIFSKTADRFENDEMDLFKELVKEETPFILLLNKELEPYEPYEEYEELPSRDKYPSTLEAMAWTSRQIYLKA